MTIKEGDIKFNLIAPLEKNDLGELLEKTNGISVKGIELSKRNVELIKMALRGNLEIITNFNGSERDLRLQIFNESLKGIK